MNSKFIYFNSRDDFFRVDYSKIVYFESDGNYTIFYLCNRLKGAVGMNLSQMQRVLSQSLKDQAAIFARVGKRYIINLNYVYRLELMKQRLTLSDGQTFDYGLSVSKDALRNLKDMFITAITSHRPITETLNQSIYQKQNGCN